jgi:hypothetical protein
VTAATRVRTAKPGTRTWFLRFDLELQDFAVVHRAVAVRHVFDRSGAVEARPGRAAADRSVLPERNTGRCGVALGDADAADRAARTGDRERRLDGPFEADTLGRRLKVIARKPTGLLSSR